MGGVNNNNKLRRARWLSKIVEAEVSDELSY
jgi:hypothetical protein